NALFYLGEVRQALTADRLAQLQQPARLNLPDPLAGDAVGPRHLLEGARVAVAEAETQLNDLALARRQRPQHLADALAQPVPTDPRAGVGRVGVVEEVLQRPLAVAAERLVQADRVARHHAQRLRLLRRDAQRRRDLFHARLTAVGHRQLTADALDGGQR